MINSITFTDKKKIIDNSSYNYITDKNSKCKKNLLGKTFEFKSGLNIIIGENGSGKSTLLDILKRITLCYDSYITLDDSISCPRLTYTGSKYKDAFEIVSVKADYRYKFFNLKLAGFTDELPKEVCSGDDVDELYAFNDNSSGEYTLRCFDKLFSKYMFNQEQPKGYHLFNYKENLIIKDVKDYVSYYNINQVDSPLNLTLFMDEPDRCLDFQTLKSIYGILTSDRKDVQIIVILHNPLLLWKLSKNPNINWIELTPNYLKKTVGEIEKFIK